MAPKVANGLIRILTVHAVAIGLLLRILLAWLLPWLLDHERFIPGVAYTDIDFHVFTDAAAHVRRGASPYARATYRYTPFLAAFLARLPTKEAGRYLFCAADAVCGWIILRYRCQCRCRCRDQLENERTAASRSIFNAQFTDAAWWLYNPLAINICTRGSAESLVALLPVLGAVWFAAAPAAPASSPSAGPRPSRTAAAVAAGLCHGVAVHAKLYPVIYTLSFLTAFAAPTHNNDASKRHTARTKASRPRALYETMVLWARRLLSPAPVLFGVTAAVTFVGLTAAAGHWYGDAAWREGLLYHVSRVDHRHNYSPHWYWIYLARDRGGGGGGDRGMPWVGRLLLAPQLILLAYTSLGVAPANLALALFVQTFLFVAHNKVITAQYFTWYLCLLPLCSDRFRWTRRVQCALLALGAAIAFWLGAAYCLEMQGMSVHRMVWLASLVFFMANVNLMGALLASSGRDAAIKKRE